MIAFIFPGQGSQKVGMGRTLMDAYPEARDVFDEADAALRPTLEPDVEVCPLSTLIFDGPESDLTLTEYAQPAILTVSIAAYRVLAARGITPAFVAGHSLGEYSANVAAGTIAFADAVRIVRRRGMYMQEAVPVGAGSMAAILGLDAETVTRACQEAAEGDVVSPANINGAGQVVIAGTTAAVTLEKTDAGFTITAVHLDVTAKIPGADQQTFEKAAENAKSGCPVSRVLNAQITMEAKLES